MRASARAEPGPARSRVSAAPHRPGDPGRSNQRAKPAGSTRRQACEQEVGAAQGTEWTRAGRQEAAGQEGAAHRKASEAAAEATRALGSRGTRKSVLRCDSTF